MKDGQNAIFINYIFPEFSDDFFVLNINFQSPTFKEIKQVRAYSTQALAGNAGGYIGLLLGYTIREIPTFLCYLYEHFMKKFNCKNEK